jgi:glycosyltransferase involved in cell wall biosynthesis
VSGTTPRLSFIVPAFNRASMIGRALRSVLDQVGDEVEMVVADDASTDGTVEAVKAMDDPRVVLVALPRNVGVCGARNAAIARARGAWLAMLDSDFEMLPGGVARLLALCDAAPEDVGNVATTCRWDRGDDTPQPMPARDLLLDYGEFCAFLQGLTVSEWFNCYRRAVFDVVRYPGGRAYEGGFHLAAAKRWRFQLVRGPVVLIHTDADNRITASPPAKLAARMLRDAADGAADAEAVLAEHGDAMARHAPGLRALYATQAMTQHLLADHRLDALWWWSQTPPARRWAPRTLGFVALGMLGGRALATVQTRVSAWRRK